MMNAGEKIRLRHSRWEYLVYSVVLLAVGVPSAAVAGQGVTLLFKSGDLIRLDDGYEQVVRAMRSGATKPLELHTGNSSLFVRLDEVLIACRDKCPGMERIEEKD